MADPRSSKIIGARMRAAATAQLSAHPDPDLLTAFAEQSLNETERAEVLEHLSQCGVCRDVVYFAQPEEQAAPLQVVKAPPQARWFAWRRLQWAALAASLSVIAAVGVLLKENPSRLATPEQVKHEVSNPGAAQDQVNQPTSTAAASKATGEGAGKADNDSSLRESLATKSPVLQEKGRVAASDASKSTENAFAFSARDDHAKTELGLADKESKQFLKAGNEKDAFSPVSSEDNKRLFDLRQQQARGGPSTANSNGMNYNIQNNLSNNGNLDGKPNDSLSASAPSPAPAAPPPPASTTGRNVGGTVSTLQKYDRTEAEKPEAAPKAVAKVAAAPATRAVVPAEEARNKKKLETIPSQPAPQGTDETVAVAGQAEEVAANRTAASGQISPAKIDDLGLRRLSTTNMLTLSPGVAVPASAATGWRVHQGQVQARISGSWHSVVVSTQPGSSTVTSSTVTTSGTFGALTGADMAMSAAPRFSSVSAVGSDIWVAQSIDPGNPYVTVYHSHNGGARWQPSILTGAANLKTDAQVNVKFKNAQQGRVLLSTGERWETSDGGAHWNLVK